MDQSVATDVFLDFYPGPYNDVTGAPPAAGGFTLYAVPEPATFALGGLGAAALMVFHRRKRE